MYSIHLDFTVAAHYNINVCVLIRKVKTYEREKKMTDVYENPLCLRYSGERMKHIFSADFKFSTWRRLWIALAEAEKELGLDITDEQLDEMRAHITDIDYERAKAYEK